MNLTRANEHVLEIYIQIRVVKERVIFVRHSLLFNRTPRLLFIHIVFVYVKMPKSPPTKRGLSTVYSPKTIMYRDNLHYKRNLALKIVQYCHVHEEDTPRNSQSARTKAAI